MKSKNQRKEQGLIIINNCNNTMFKHTHTKTENKQTKKPLNLKSTIRVLIYTKPSVPEVYIPHEYT